MAKKIATQVFAFLALFGIIIGIVGTGILFFFGSNGTEEVKTLSKEELERLIKSSTGVQVDNSVEEMINTGSLEEVGTGSIKN